MAIKRKANADGRPDIKKQRKTAISEPRKPQTSQEKHAVQKEERHERRMAKPNAPLIVEAKRKWEQVRQRKGIAADERKELVAELYDLTKGHIVEIIFKHDASRVIQTLLKYGNPTQRDSIAEELQGNYTELASSAYGKWLVVKILHYGSPKARALVLSEFKGKVFKLIKHKDASLVIDDAFRDYADARQREALFQELYGPGFALFNEEPKSLDEIFAASPEKRPHILKNLFDVCRASVDKELLAHTIIHRALLAYATHMNASEQEEFLDFMHEQVAEIAHTKDGAQVGIRCVALASAKQRKAMLKALKPHVVKLAEDEYGHLLLIALFDMIDDTVLVGRTILPEISQHVTSMASHKFARRPLLFLLVGLHSRYFNPSTIAAYVGAKKGCTSKKDAKVRQDELLNIFSPAFLQSIQRNTGELLKSPLGGQFLTEALLRAKGDKSESVAAVASVMRGTPAGSSHLIHYKHTPRILRTLIQGAHWDSAKGALEEEAVRLEFASVLWEVVKEHFEAWCVGEGSYVALAMLEAGPDDVREAATASKRAIEQAAAANKGSALILEQL